MTSGARWATVPALPDEHLGAAVWRDDEHAPPRALRFGPDRPDRQARRGAQHLAHLHLGERRSGAAPHTSAERDPRHRVWRRALEPALGPGRAGLRPEVPPAPR